MEWMFFLRHWGLFILAGFIPLYIGAPLAFWVYTEGRIGDAVAGLIMAVGFSIVGWAGVMGLLLDLWRHWKFCQSLDKISWTPRIICLVCENCRPKGLSANQEVFRQG